MWIEYKHSDHLSREKHSLYLLSLVKYALGKQKMPLANFSILVLYFNSLSLSICEFRERYPPFLYLIMLYTIKVEVFISMNCLLEVSPLCPESFLMFPELFVLSQIIIISFRFMHIILIFSLLLPSVMLQCNLKIRIFNSL